MEDEIDRHMLGLNFATHGCSARLIAIALDADLPSEKLQELEKHILRVKEILTTHIADMRKELKK